MGVKCAVFETVVGMIDEIKELGIFIHTYTIRGRFVWSHVELRWPRMQLRHAYFSPWTRIIVYRKRGEICCTVVAVISIFFWREEEDMLEV